MDGGRPRCKQLIDFTTSCRWTEICYKLDGIVVAVVAVILVLVVVVVVVIVVVGSSGSSTTTANSVSTTLESNTLESMPKTLAKFNYMMQLAILRLWKSIIIGKIPYNLFQNLNTNTTTAVTTESTQQEYNARQVSCTISRDFF
uniref:Uncharacterized protein n=1 Tax=Glossina brevipalpis TaxID=37001 RepID=A0A1A9W674_9MUSC